MSKEYRLNKLKEEYNLLCFAKMIYGTNTDSQRAKVLAEIERLEEELKIN